MLPPGAHPPPLPGAPGFDETYRWLVDGLPARLRQPAEKLPWTLGLTQVARRPLERLRAPAPQSPAAALRRPGVEWRARPDRRSSSLPSCAPTISAPSPGWSGIASKTGRSRSTISSSIWPKLSSSAGARRSSRARGRPAGGCALPPRHGALGTGNARGTERAGGRFSPGADLRGRSSGRSWAGSARRRRRCCRRPATEGA